MKLATACVNGRCTGCGGGWKSRSTRMAPRCGYTSRWHFCMMHRRPAADPWDIVRKPPSWGPFCQIIHLTCVYQNHARMDYCTHTYHALVRLVSDAIWFIYPIDLRDNWFGVYHLGGPLGRCSARSSADIIHRLRFRLFLVKADR